MKEIFDMANWKNKIDISKEFEKYNDEKCTVREVADTLIAALRKTPFNGDEFIMNCIDELEMLDDDDEGQFDYILNDLMEFGDVRKRLFIKCYIDGTEVD